MTQSEQASVDQLSEYGKTGNYLNDIIDIFVVALSDVTKSTIIIYYPFLDSVRHHVIKPTENENVTSVELSFVCTHYDLVLDKLIQCRQSNLNCNTLEEISTVINITDSPVKCLDFQDIKKEVKTEQILNIPIYSPSRFTANNTFEISDSDEENEENFRNSLRFQTDLKCFPQAKKVSLECPLCESLFRETDTLKKHIISCSPKKIDLITTMENQNIRILRMIMTLMQMM